MKEFILIGKQYKEAYKSKRLKIKRYFIDLLGGKCIDCGYEAHLAALDFDHVDESSKKFGLGDGFHKFALNKISIEELHQEAQKCVIRCANCHRIKTHPDATDKR